MKAPDIIEQIDEKQRTITVGLVIKVSNSSIGLTKELSRRKLVNSPRAECLKYRRRVIDPRWLGPSS